MALISRKIFPLIPGVALMTTNHLESMAIVILSLLGPMAIQEEREKIRILKAGKV
jgi:hypothetical protein